MAKQFKERQHVLSRKCPPSVKSLVGWLVGWLFYHHSLFIKGVRAFSAHWKE